MVDARSTPGVVLSAALPRHVRGIVAVERDCFSDPWSEASFYDALANPCIFFQVATEGAEGPIVGYVVAWFVADQGEIANVAVAPRARGRGIGGLLIDEAISAAEIHGAEAVYLDVRESNARARALYRSRGFVEVGRRRRYYRRPSEDAIVLRRAIISHGAAASGV